MVIKGKLITCKRQVKQFEKAETKNKLWITLAEVELSDKKKAELAEAYKDSGKKFTPDWLKDFKGYVNLSTDFELPCKDPDGNEYHSIERFITEDKFPFMGAECKVSINIKDGAVYPNSLIFLGEGKPFNPFAEFDNDDED